MGMRWENGVSKTGKELLAAPALQVPELPLHPGPPPRCGMHGSSGVPISWRCTVLRGAGCGPRYAASSY